MRIDGDPRKEREVTDIRTRRDWDTHRLQAWRTVREKVEKLKEKTVDSSWIIRLWTSRKLSVNLVDAPDNYANAPLNVGSL